MSTLAADKPRTYEFVNVDKINELPVIASDIIWEGSGVGELNDTGTYQPLATGSTIDKFAGFCTEKVDNSAGSAGAKRVKVIEEGCIVVAVTGASAITDVGKDVYMTDDDTFTLTNSGVWVGKVKRWILSTSCVVDFKAFRLRPSIFVVHSAETVDLATDRAFFVAPWACYIQSITQVHSVAAGGASKLQVTKETTTGAPGAGTNLLTNNSDAGFDLNATADTVQYGTLVTTAGVRKLAKGDRLSIDYADAIQSTAGNKITVELIRL